MDGAGAGARTQYWQQVWNEWEIQIVVVASFSLQVILFFFAGIRRYSVSFVLKALLWLVYLLADVVAMYALGHMSSVLSKKSTSEHQLVAFWAPFLLLHLGGQDTITAYALEDNELWLRHLLNMSVQVACTTYVLYKYMVAGGATFAHAAMLVLAAGVIKYGERIWALKRASKSGSHYKIRRARKHFLRVIFDTCCHFFQQKKLSSNSNSNSIRDTPLELRFQGEDCFTRNRQFVTYAYIVRTAHALSHVLVKPLIIDRNEASIDWSDTTIDLVKGQSQGCPWQDDESEDALAKEKRPIGELYKAIEVQLALMYDMLYTKAEVIHKRRGHWIRAISLVCCFAALVVFTKSKRDGYGTPNVVITFALLGGACTLEVASVIKAIGSTWTYAILRDYGWSWMPNAILFARYHLTVVKDGRWSDSVGQFNFTSFCVHSGKKDLKGRLARLFGIKDSWDKSHCTKHAKLSPALKEFVWGLLKGGDKSHTVKIEDVAIRNGYWARKFSGFEQSHKLNWTMSFEFQKSVLIWHIAQEIFLNNSAVTSELVDKDMAEAVNTLSNYMMYLLVKHPDMLPVKAATQNLVHQACISYSKDLRSTNIYDVLEYKKVRSTDMKILYGDWGQEGWDDHPGEAVVVKACGLAQTMLAMKLGLTHKVAIFATVWMEMLSYAATNASGGFHARQLSNGGEFLTHILLLTEYCSAITGVTEFRAIKDINRKETQGHIFRFLNRGNLEFEKLDTDVPRRKRRKGAKPCKAIYGPVDSLKINYGPVADSAADHVYLNVNDDNNNEITEIR